MERVTAAVLLRKKWIRWQWASESWCKVSAVKKIITRNISEWRNDVVQTSTQKVDICISFFQIHNAQQWHCSSNKNLAKYPLISPWYLIGDLFENIFVTLPCSRD